MKKPRDLQLDLSKARVLTTVVPGVPAAVPPARRGGARPSKYRNQPTIYNGLRFDSKAEAARAAFLDGSGMSRYVRQPRFTLGVPENVYVADFLVWTWDGKVHAEDVKGARTAKFNRDVKLWKAYGPTQLWIITGNKIEYVNGGRDPVALHHGTAGDSRVHEFGETP